MASIPHMSFPAKVSASRAISLSAALTRTHGSVASRMSPSTIAPTLSSRSVASAPSALGGHFIVLLIPQSFFLIGSRALLPMLSRLPLSSLSPSCCPWLVFFRDTLRLTSSSRAFLRSYEPLIDKFSGSNAYEPAFWTAPPIPRADRE
jgi:hypothetical protein